MIKGIVGLLTVIFILTFSQVSFSQYTIEGNVKNKEGENLEFASVFLNDNIHGTTTDAQGNFILKDIESGIYILKVTYLSYIAFAEEVEVDDDGYIDIVLTGNATQLEALEVIANRVEKDNPIAHDNISRETIEANNFGKDIPVILQNTPSLVLTSDAGNGVGYTSMRIRGFDITRINVNINGVPLNDAESQAVFFVDIPDLLSSTEDIQVQRGVGSSTNGPGAFGASVSLNTNRNHINPYIDLGLGYGSYNTKHFTGALGTGLMNGKYSIDIRYSIVKSDGYLDRASSSLNSYYLSASRLWENSSLKFISFSGKEKTYQAWYGTPKEKLFGTADELLEHYNRNKGGIYKNAKDSINLFSSDRKYNYYTYDNQIDDYKQSHYQLHFNKIWSPKVKTKSALYSSLGRGFYEEYKYQDKYSNYGLAKPIVGIDTFSRGNIIRRRNLNNILYGAFINTLIDVNQNSKLDIGLAGSTYTGEHYGNVIQAEHQTQLDSERNYYYSEGNKSEASIYAKYEWKPSLKLSVFADMQYRIVNYNTAGTDNDQQNFDLDHDFGFFNPKLGVSYKLNSNSSLNLFAGISNREPSRNDFVDVVKDDIPKAEKIYDYELAYRFGAEKMKFELNAFFMKYDNQLVLRGDLNDVGASIRVNVDNSSRSGLEGQANVQWTDKFRTGLNLSLSNSRIKEYEEHIFDYGTGEAQVTTYNDKPISFSPRLVGNLNLGYEVLKNWDINWDTRYVSKQYIDNTGDEEKTISAYTVSDLSTSYTYKGKIFKELRFSLKAGNVFNALYASNAYTYAYIYGDKITETFYYPQAERNFSLAMKLSF